MQAIATRDLDLFDLDLEGFQVTSVTVDGTPGRPLAKNARLAVGVRYVGEPVGDGPHTLADGGSSVLGEAHAATAWYPASGHPSDKATFLE